MVVVGSDEAVGDATTAADGQAHHGAVVLHRDRHASERAVVAGLDRRRGLQGAVGVEVGERVDARLDGLDALQCGGRQLGGAHLAAADERGELASRSEQERVQIVGQGRLVSGRGSGTVLARAG